MGLSFFTLVLRPMDEKKPPPEDLWPGRGNNDRDGDGMSVEERAGLRFCCACARDGYGRAGAVGGRRSVGRVVRSVAL